MSQELPSLERLSLQPPGRSPLDDLPPDLLIVVLETIDSDHPCEALSRLCNSNKQWASWCKQGWLHEAANSALGYYGEQGTWEAVVRHYKKIGQEPAATPQAYFQQACLARFNPDTLTGVETYHPFYGARLLQQARSRLEPDSFQHVPPYLWNYNAVAKAYMKRDSYVFRYISFFYRADDYSELARFAVQQDGTALQHVPAYHKDYGAIAKLAVQNDASAIAYVNASRADYFELAKLAVQEEASALEHVPTFPPDRFGVIAKIALQIYGYALEYVPTDRTDWGALAKLAVQTHGSALEYVPRNRADYSELAKLAVQQDGIALLFVPKWNLPADYSTIAKLAVQNNGYALEFVPTVRLDYGAIAKLAVTKDGGALKYVPTDREDYDEIAKLVV